MHKIRFLKIIVSILLLLVVAGSLRFYKLDKFPVQLNHDEISQIYDVISIAKTGKDIYGNPFPLAFKSTGDYKPGHYIYISVLPYLLFGNHEVIIRIPSAFFGTLSAISVFIFTLIITNNLGMAFIAGLLFAINPSDIFYARKSFESVIGVFLMFSGLSFVLKYIEGGKKVFLKYLGVILLVLSMYVYTSYTVIIPLLLLLLALVYRNKLFRGDRLQSAVFLIVLLLPLLYITFINRDIKFRASSVFVSQDPSLGTQLDYIKSGNTFVEPILTFKVYIDYIFEKFLNQLDPVHIFVNGLDFTNQGYLGMGSLMFVEFPFFLAGLIFLIKKYNHAEHKKFLLGSLLISFLPSAITFENYSPHRSVAAFSVMTIVVAFGLYWVICSVRRIKSGLIKTMVFLAISIAFLFNFAYFWQMYTVNLPYEKSQHIHYPYKEVAEFAWSQHRNYQQIVIDPLYGEVWPVRAVAVQYYLAYYGNYPPDQLQREYKEESGVISFNNFQIRQVEWSKDSNLANTLLIASPWSIPAEIASSNRIIKTFYFYDRTPAFYAIKP